MNEADISHPKRIAVIGGGLSGLSAAHRVLELSAAENRPVELTLFEAGDRLGGVIGTQQIDDYLVEMGADSFITNKLWALELCHRLGLEDQLIPTDEAYRRSLVLRRGRPVPVPEGFMLMAPAKIWPVLTSPIFSLLGKLRLGWEYFVPKRTETTDESLAAFVRRRLGREALERLIQPLVGGIYTSDLEKLSLQATLPRFPEMERQHRSLIRAARKQGGKAESSGSGARYGLFATLRNGVSTLFDELEKRIAAEAQIQLEVSITAIRPTNQQGRPRWRVEMQDGTAAEFDGVILATRAYQAADLVSGFDEPLAGLLKGIEYASSAIVVTGHRLSEIEHPLNAFGLVIPAIENRDILAISFSSRKFPGRAPDGKVLLRTFIGGAMQPEMMEHDDDSMIEIARREMRDILGATGEPDFARVARYNNAMPQYHVGHLERVKQIDTQMNSHPGIALAGNAYHGVGIPDCVHSGESAAKRIIQEMTEINS
jgi:protoporphyrinogen/coproporphyrinogen III oxidase